MNYTLKQLRYFVASAEAGSITQASKTLAISQPSLSAAIAQLEATFGIQLFLRHRAQGLSLTPSGRQFLSAARRLLDHAEELVAGARGLGHALDGPLEIGCYVTLAPVFLPRLLKTFGERHPATRVNFREANVDVLLQDLASGTTELALAYDLDLAGRVETEALAGVAPYVLLAADHPLAKREAIPLEALIDEPMVLFDLPHSGDYFRSLFLTIGTEPEIRHRTASYEMVRGLVANGHGFSLLSLLPVSTRSYDGRRLVGRPLAHPVPPLPIVLARAKGARLSRRAEAFAEHARGFFAGGAPGLGRAGTRGRPRGP